MEAENVEIDWRLNRGMTSNSDENSHLHLTGSSSEESIPGTDAPQSASPSQTQWMGMQWPLPTHWNCPGWQVSGAVSDLKHKSLGIKWFGSYIPHYYKIENKKTKTHS
jgi:hypothetical protein